MKKIILFLAIGILFQSCYSYKAIENNPSELIIGKHYKVKQDKKSIKLKITSKTDSTIVFRSNSKEQVISNDEITNIKKRKFSVVKTAFSSIGLLIVIGTIASPPSMGGSLDGIQYPP